MLTRIEQKYEEKLTVIEQAIHKKEEQNNINQDWTSIVRIMNSQKMNTIKMKTKEVHIRKASILEKHVAHIYKIMSIKESL
jgi:hypothetical protein